MWDLIKICDHDFSPTLSSREKSLHGPVTYFEGLFNDQSKIQLAFDQQVVVGFSIFYHNYESQEIQDYTPCNYVKIACVHPDYRGEGIASAFNKFIESKLPVHLQCPYIVRRTWTNNLIQVYLLEKNGYQVFLTHDNDRGFGNSTVYYYKVMESKTLYKWMVPSGKTRQQDNGM